MNPTQHRRFPPPTPPSTKGHGTTPARDLAARSPRRAAPRDLRDPDSRWILVVEDDPTFAKLLTTYLDGAEEQQYRSVVADTLQAALDRLQDDPFDVIIADLGLPDAKDYETIEALTDAAPDVPIVVLTGTVGGGVDTSLEAVRRGAAYFLRKGHVDSGAIERGIRYATDRRDLRRLLEQNEEDRDPTGA